MRELRNNNGKVSLLVDTEKVNNASSGHDAIKCIIERIQIEYLKEVLKDLAKTSSAYTYKEANNWCKQDPILSTLIHLEKHIQDVTVAMVNAGWLESKPLTADEMLFENKMGLGTEMKTNIIELN